MLDYVIIGGCVIILLALWMIDFLNRQDRNREQQEIKENQRVDTSVSLSQIVIKVLDIYEESHIRIPADIIEDLSYMRFHDEKEVFTFIENQRNYWKLENTKKPYRKEVK